LPQRSGHVAPWFMGKAEDYA